MYDAKKDLFQFLIVASFTFTFFCTRPGYPIFLVVGGEDGNDYGHFFPFIEEQLASKYGAFVVHPEHRFYGISQPIDPSVATTDDLKRLLTAKQAIADMLSIVQFFQEQFGCSKDKTSSDYCPVMAVGGSYPGVSMICV